MNRTVKSMNNVDELIPHDTTSDPELTPGQPATCAGNGDCCDECDHFLLCFPEFDSAVFPTDEDLRELASRAGSEDFEPEEFREIDAYLREQTTIELFGLALIRTHPSILTERYADVLSAFEAYMRKEFGRCEELDSVWARNRIRGVRAFHMLTTDFPE